MAHKTIFLSMFFFKLYPSCGLQCAALSAVRYPPGFILSPPQVLVNYFIFLVYILLKKAEAAHGSLCRIGVLLGFVLAQPLLGRGGDLLQSGFFKRDVQAGGLDQLVKRARPAQADQ